MLVDMAAFTPWSALAGGGLIGLAAGLFVVANGRIAGISGLLGSLLQRAGEGRGEKLLFLLGIIAAPLLWRAFSRCRQCISVHPPGCSWSRGFWWAWYPLRQRLHQWPWGVRPVPPVPALGGSDVVLHGGRLCHRLRGSPPLARSMK